MTQPIFAGMHRLLKEEAGHDMVEYALIVGLLALGAVVVLKGFSTTLTNLTFTLIDRGAAAWPQ